MVFITLYTTLALSNQNNMNNYNSLRPHMVHFARLRSQYRPVYVNWLIGYALRTSDGWNRLMALIYAQ